MQRVLRPLAVFTIASAVGLATTLRDASVGGASGSDGRLPGSGGYDLRSLELTKETLFHVDHGYVDPDVDWDRVVAGGLDAVERLVPAVTFGRSRAPDGAGGTLSVAIGDFVTVLEAPPVEDVVGATEFLEEVAGLLADHLAPRDVPDEDPSGRNGGSDLPPLARVEYALVNGMLATLDPHSVLLPPEAAHEMDLENQGEFGGLGITIDLDEAGQLRVQCPIPGTPAAAAGIRPLDRVVRIDGESTLNMSLDDAIELLRGPVGEGVRLDVEHAPDPGGEAAGRAESIVVRREMIASNPVESALLEGGVGWVRVQSFHERASTDVIDALGRLRREAGGELRGLVLDLRGNPGGFLTQAVRIADVFLESGDIVSTVDGSGRETEAPEVATHPAEPDYPMAVLLDASSASASEIVAGALRYNDRAVVVGERSFGKGSVQNLHAMRQDAKLKLTVSRYLTTGQRSLQAVGIPADIELAPAVFDAGGGAHLFHRERARREADLAHALSALAPGDAEAAWSLRFPTDPAPDDCSDADVVRRLARDPQLAFARDLLVAAPGAHRRPDVLAAAERTIGNRSRAWDAEIVRRFGALGVDWTTAATTPDTAAPDAPPRPPAPPKVALDVTPAGGTTSPDGAILAGTEASVTLRLTNPGPEPLTRVAAVLTGAEPLHGREVFFGRVGPGETREVAVPVSVPAGSPTERAPVHVSVRAGCATGEPACVGGHRELAASDLALRIDGGGGVPAFAWTVAAEDRGDGDGVLEAGEELALTVTLENVGPGAAPAPHVRLRNRSGRAAELVDATFRPGPLAAGASATGVLRARVAEGTDLPPLTFALEVGDDQAWDRGTFSRADLWDWYLESETLAFDPGEPLPPTSRRSPPAVAITRAPPGETSAGRVTVSGEVTDDRGLAEVLVFASAPRTADHEGNPDKLFADGRRGARVPGAEGATFRSVPFTADVPLRPGENVVSVVARDDQGFASTRSVVIWSSGDGLATLHEPGATDAGTPDAGREHAGPAEPE